MLSMSRHELHLLSFRELSMLLLLRIFPVCTHFSQKRGILSMNTHQSLHRGICKGTPNVKMNREVIGKELFYKLYLEY